MKDKILDAEKISSREWLISALKQNLDDQNIRKQLIRCLQHIIKYEYKCWPELLPKIKALLSEQEIKSVYSGLILLRSLCCIFEYEFDDSRSNLDLIAAETFPLV